MLNAGAMRDRIRFERRQADANGDAVGPWQEVCTVWAKIVWLRGSEPVLAQRLQGVQPAVIYVRASAATKSLDNACRAVDARVPKPGKGDFFAIRGKVLSDDRADVEVTAERGADG